METTGSTMGDTLCNVTLNLGTLVDVALRTGGAQAAESRPTQVAGPTRLTTLTAPREVASGTFLTVLRVAITPPPIALHEARQISHGTNLSFIAPQIASSVNSSSTQPVDSAERYPVGKREKSSKSVTAKRKKKSGASQSATALWLHPVQSPDNQHCFLLLNPWFRLRRNQGTRCGPWLQICNPVKLNKS